MYVPKMQILTYVRARSRHPGAQVSHMSVNARARDAYGMKERLFPFRGVVGHRRLSTLYIAPPRRV